MFFKKEQLIEGMIDEYLELLDDMIFALRETVKAYLQKNRNFDARVEKISNADSEMDKLRRNIQVSLYQHSLMPEIREDILYMMYGLDALPDLAEHAVMDIQLEQPDIPEVLHSDLVALLDKVTLEIKSLILATEALFSDLKAVRGHVNEAIREEAEADDIEYSLIQNIYALNTELAHKNQLKMIINSFADIADAAEGAAESILIYATKRAI